MYYTSVDCTTLLLLRLSLVFLQTTLLAATAVIPLMYGALINLSEKQLRSSQDLFTSTSKNGEKVAEKASVKTQAKLVFKGHQDFGEVTYSQ